MLQGYIEQYGPEAGSKIYHVVRSRAAYKGVSTKRRRRIEALIGRPYRLRRKATPAQGQGLLPLAGRDAPARRDTAIGPDNAGPPANIHPEGQEEV